MIDRLDYLVLTVQNLEATIVFYTRALGMKEVTLGSGRKALQFGQQKINLHTIKQPFEPKASHPTSGSADLCFITTVSVGKVIEQWKTIGVKVVEGPVTRTGALGPILSVYCRDPDGNLIEIANDVR